MNDKKGGKMYLFIFYSSITIFFYEHQNNRTNEKRNDAL